MTTALRGGPKTDAMADLLLPTMASAGIGNDCSRPGRATPPAPRSLDDADGDTPMRRMTPRKNGVRAVRTAVTIPANVAAIHRSSWLSSLTPLDRASAPPPPVELTAPLCLG